jgi:hypothetical protein
MPPKADVCPFFHRRPAVAKTHSLFGWAATGWAGPAAANQRPQSSIHQTSQTSQYQIQTQGEKAGATIFKFWRQTHQHSHEINNKTLHNSTSDR